MSTTTTSTPPPANVSKKELNRQHHELAQWGNYHNYYFHRTPVVPDARLSLLPRALFTSKHVLDLGCNAGKLTLETVSHLAAATATGVDLDPFLIDQAGRLAKENGVAGVEFGCADFMLDSEAWFGSRRGEFDTVLLFSITKWLHLHHGDAGLRKLFEAIFECLPSGGALVVEPQEWENYKSAVKKNRNLRDAFRALDMRPPFRAELEGVGFRLEKEIEREEGGFSRPLLVWRKE
ncbi:ribosomal L11 methyltransferase, PrmA [Pseudohyphozyma bogoriensis]|nr:ribosomal L11 methyltransferase, PrmA [Pseudohyphozyma bogoriensis]